MDHLGVIGLSWRHASSEDVARFCLPKSVQSAEVAEFARRMELREVLYLATCSRVELIYRSDAQPDAQELRRRVFETFAGRRPQPGEAERTLRAWTGEGAAEHLLLVATGLDSAQLGETEVLGQIREALTDARENGLAQGVLGFVVEEVIKIARRLRRQTGLDLGQTSLAEIALQHLADAQAAETIPGRKSLPVGLLGVSAMTERFARGLAEKGGEVLWVNRTAAKADAALQANRVPGRAVSIDEFSKHPEALAGLVCATGSLDPVLTSDVLRDLAQHHPRMRVVDLGVPPDVDAAHAHAAGLSYLGMNEILARADQNSQARKERAIEARVGIDAALQILRDRVGTSALGPIARAVQDHYQETAQSSLERLFRKDLPELSPEAQAKLLRWSQTLASQMAHLPTTGLRQVVREKGTSALHAFLAHASPELAQKIEVAIEAAALVEERPEHKADSNAGDTRRSKDETIAPTAAGGHGDAQAAKVADIKPSSAGMDQARETGGAA